MSLACFIASDRTLNDYSAGVEDRGYALFIEDEKKVLNIFRYIEEEWTDLSFITSLTENPVYSCLEYNDFSTIKYTLLSYIKDAMKKNTSLEIWYTWNYENAGLEKKTKNIDELTLEDLNWILGDKYFKNPKCLKVFKYARGKK